MTHRLFIRLAVLLVAVPAWGGEPYLLRNINPHDAGFPPSSPRSASIVGSTEAKVFFFAAGLWVTDGTPEGTRSLGAEVPGFQQRTRPFYSTVDRMYLTVEDQLWTTDGTPEGSHQLTFPPVHSRDSGPALGRLDATGELLFGGGDRALWATDGTPEGTRRVADVEPWEPVASENAPKIAEVADGLLFAGSPSHAPVGDELWISDGTPEGTHQVLEMASEPGHGLPQHLASAAGGLAAFIQRSDAHGWEPWITDGTPGGTRLLADANPGPDSSYIGTGFHAAGGLLYFAVTEGPQSGLWRTDGTPGGTVRIPLSGDAFLWNPDDFRPVAVGERLLFSATDADHGIEPWITDGTAAGTHRLADLCPGPCSTYPSAFHSTSLGVVFRGIGAQERPRLWVTDGTVAGTRVLFDLCSFSPCSGTTLLGDLGGRLVINAWFDGFSELWATTGTPESSVRLIEWGGASWSSTEMAGDRLVLVSGSEVWSTDGRPSGTALLRDIDPGSDDSSFPNRFVRFGGEVFYFADDGEWQSLWATDGTVGGTHRVRDLVLSRSTEDTALTNLIAFDGDLYFFRWNYLNFRTAPLWRSDGTSAGTVEIARPPSDWEWTTAVAGDDEIFLLGEGIWRADRTPGSAERLADIWTRPSSGVLEVGGTIYFAATADLVERSDLELWRSDGTPSGTHRVIDLAPGEASSQPFLRAVHKEEVYFLARQSEGQPRELWVTDGTQSGTRRAELPGATGEVEIVGVVGDRLLFTDQGAGPGASRRLVTTNGMAGGTQVLADPFSPEKVALAKDRLYALDDDSILTTDGTVAGTSLTTGWRPQYSPILLASAQEDGLLLEIQNRYLEHEVWVSDGTAGGTRRVVELMDTRPSLFPSALSLRMILFGDLLLFADDRDVRGRELWATDLSPSGPVRPPSSPRRLTAEPVSSSAIRLAWEDVPVNAQELYVVARWPFATHPFRLLVAEVPANATGLVVSGLPSNLPMTFQVRAGNATGLSDYSNRATATTLPREAGPCEPSDESLCLLDDRFAVRVRWFDHHNSRRGIGHAEAFTGSNRAGRFWFFDEDKVELIVKQLDGRGINGAFWTFYGALSDVEYWVTVTDTTERRSRTYYNPPGTICGRGDTGAFPATSPVEATTSGQPIEGTLPEVDLSAFIAATQERLERSPTAEPTRSPGLATAPAEAGSCVPTPEVLCLGDGRYRVEVTWRDQHNGGTGNGHAVAGSPESGYFWFFDDENIELVVKVLDGTPVNGHVWVFYGALSDVEYTIEVTDTVTELSRSYTNQPGEICGRADLAAF